MTATITQLRPTQPDAGARAGVRLALDLVTQAITNDHAPRAPIAATLSAIAGTRTQLHRAAQADGVTLPALHTDVVQALCRAVWPQDDDEAPTPLLGARAALRQAVELIDRRDWLSAHRLLATATAFLELAQEGL